MSTITPSTVTTMHNGKTKKVKNLAWMLSKSRYVKAIAFDFGAKNVFQDGILIVTLAIGNNAPTHEYRTGFASYEVLRDLLRRSQWLRSLPVEERNHA